MLTRPEFEAIIYYTPLNSIDTFEGIHYRISETQAPMVIDNADVYLETRVTQEVDVGTHTIFIGQLVDAGVIAGGECMTNDIIIRLSEALPPRQFPAILKKRRRRRPQ